MLDKDNFISTSVLEAVEKIPTNEKDYRKYSFMCFTLDSYSIQRTDQHIANSRNSCLPTRIHLPKKITEGILHKIYTEKGVIIGILLVLSILEVRSSQIQVSWQIVDAGCGG